MVKNGTLGSNTKTGLKFEKHVDFCNLLSKVKGYSIKESTIGNDIYYLGNKVASSYKKYDLYRYIESLGFDWRKNISKRLLPDDALYVVVNNTLFIIEVKFQEVSGSVDEKLQTCDFKKKQYKKLLAQLNVEIEFIYILSNWFNKFEYKDTLDYVIDMGCQYYFEYLPLQKIGLPMPK